MVDHNPTPNLRANSPTPATDATLRIFIKGPVASGKTLVLDLITSKLRAMGLIVTTLATDDTEHAIAVTHPEGVPSVFFAVQAIAEREPPMRDPDGLAHYTSITSQTELRKIVETATANGHRSGLDEAHKNRTKYAGPDLLTAQNDGHTEGYAKAQAEHGTALAEMRQEIAALGDAMLNSPAGKLQSQNDSLRAELTATRAHIAELQAKLDKAEAPDSLRISIMVNDGGAINVYPDSEHSA